MAVTLNQRAYAHAQRLLDDGRAVRDDREDLVTDLDAAFAQAVEDLIDDVLRERTPPASPPTPEREVAPRRPPAQPVPGTSHRRGRHRDH